MWQCPKQTLTDVVPVAVNEQGLTTLSRLDEPPRANALCVIAKYPCAGKSKTRLAASVGDKKAVEIAHALVCDVLFALGPNHGSPLGGWAGIVVFGPASCAGPMQKLVEELGPVGAAWRLGPLSEAAFESRDLTIILKEAYKVAKAAEQTGGVVFVGMDCPFLTREMVAGAAQHTDTGKAYICPADDGGYTLLALPRGAPEGVFEGVEWSCGRTCETQVVALQRAGLEVVVGPTLADVDTVQDLQLLEERLMSDATLALPALRAALSKPWNMSGSG